MLSKIKTSNEIGKGIYSSGELTITLTSGKKITGYVIRRVYGDYENRPFEMIVDENQNEITESIQEVQDSESTFF